MPLNEHTTMSCHISFTMLKSILIPIVLFSTFATATEHVNLTLSVPNGTSIQGDNDLLCLPTRWSDVVLFIFGNYAAHAVTIVSRPGEPYRDYALRVFVAFLFPHMECSMD